MRKKVLLAEQSDATRSVAETILRQNGFEVIAVTDGERAAEVLENTRPDLIIAGAELQHGGRPVYERIKENQTTADTPLLLFTDKNRAGLPFPEETLIPRPFDPRMFLNRVMVFTGTRVGAAQPASGSETAGDFPNESHGEARGTNDSDQIHVTDSSVMDNTTKIRRRKAQDGDSDDMTDTGRVESIIIEDDQTDIRRPGTQKIKQVDESSQTGGLDILDDHDQYNLHETDQFADGIDDDREHDYHWFINEMQKEVDKIDGPPGKGSADQPAEDLSFTDPADSLEPFKMPPETKPRSREQRKPAQESPGSGGVEKFIDEFKKEIEKFEGGEPQNVTVREEDSPPADTDWEESIESLTPQRVELFTRQLAADLAASLAEKIVAKIDSDKLLEMLRAEILVRARKPKP